MRIYLASSWRNELQPAVLRELRIVGHEVYDFRNPAPGNTGFGWRQCTDKPIKDCSTLREVLAHPVAQHGFNCDYNAMRWAEACVLLLPCGNSAHLEAGWFAGQGKPVAVMVPELREPELMYKCFDSEQLVAPLFDDVAELCAHLAQVERTTPTLCESRVLDQMIDERLRLRARVAELESALQRIADHPHIAYDCSGSVHARASYHPDDSVRTAGRMYEIGAADGHRCCADIARRALGREVT